MTSEARTSFNLKVLRRHDASIVSIVSTASFVVLYNYNNGEWTKTGVEGPLFLFRRRLPPYNGFFLMNRNGVENFSADITPDDDLEITPDFIIYRPEKSGDNEVYGIWVFEEKQRREVGEEMVKLQKMVDGPSEEEVREAVRASGSEVVELGVGDGKQGAAAKKEKVEGEGKAGKGKANGGKPKKGAKQAAAAATAAVGEKSTDDEPTRKDISGPNAEAEAGTQINLDDLFGSSAPTPAQPAVEPTPTHPDSAEQPASNGTSLLDSLFQKASLDSTPTSSTPEAPKADNSHSQNLLALLGGSSPSPAPAADTQTKPLNSTPTTAPHPPPVPAGAGGAPKMSDLIEAGIRDRIGLDDDGKPLSRREFVTELLSMVHTNPEFVTELYDSYVSRVS